MRVGPDTPYARWCAWLEQFATGADAPPDGLPAMDPAQVGGHTAARFAERCADALQQRLARWHELLARDLERIVTPLDALEALHAARRRLAPARTLTTCKQLFPELREALASSLADVLAQAQHQLEQTAHAARADGEQLLRAVREVRVDLAPALDLGAPPAPEQSGAPARRSVLLR